MSINPHDLRDQVIVPACRALGILNPAAVNLLLGTAAQESHLGEYALVQRGGGPAVGIFQMEPATYLDTWARSPAALKTIVLRHVAPGDIRDGIPDPRLMITDLRFATMVARLKYWIVPNALPPANDQSGLWAYYKRWWNSVAGAATREQWDANWSRYAAAVAASPGTTYA